MEDSRLVKMSNGSLLRRLRRYCSGSLGALMLVGCSTPAQVDSAVYRTAAEQLDVADLAQVLTLAQVDELAAPGSVAKNTDPERAEELKRTSAALVALGALDGSQPAGSDDQRSRLDSFLAVVPSGHPALLGRIGDPSLLAHLYRPLDHDALLASNDVLQALGKALAEGVLTGYDLRARAVYDGFPANQTFVYSHSSPAHLRQLVTVLSVEEVRGWVYLTPKVSAFLHRAEWGVPGPNVVELADGTAVVQGREMAVLFRFDTVADRARFHDIVQRVAKRDSEDEVGLIKDAWWQPFYYANEPVAGFEPIALVVLTAGDVEATLTVVHERAEQVIAALRPAGYTLRRDDVWVNPAFFRFLNGGYR